MAGKGRIMKPGTSQYQTETALVRERRIFREEYLRLRNCLLNKTFDLSAAGSHRRGMLFFGLVVVTLFYFMLQAHTLGDWAQELSGLFQFIFNPVYATAAPDTPSAFVAFALGPFLEPETLRFLPVLVLPLLFALQAAAGYLADVFELKKIATARDFIWQVAFAGAQKAMRIGGGEVATKSLDSPVYQIGGPGKVVVELDTVAVFEKPNGQPHCIGPTVKGGATLEGFERFRQALDLRDQFTDPLEVKSRSRDGIPISARDARMVFSIWREGKHATPESPHPFSKQAVEALVYGQTCSVIADGPFPSECNPSWSDTIQTLIRNSLDGFMSEHPLAEYLASIGQPEVQQAREWEEEIAKAEQAVTPAEQTPEPREVPGAPNFHARPVVSSLFRQFEQEFSEGAGERGVEIRWYGIGVWKTPSAIIPEKHLEAWRLSRENLARGSLGALSRAKSEARLNNTLKLIQTVPLGRFRENLEKGQTHAHTARDLLIAYREQFLESKDLIHKTDKPLHEDLDLAVQAIDKALNLRWIKAAAESETNADPSSATASSTPVREIPGLTTEGAYIPPADPEEESLYLELLNRADQDPQQVEELIENERKRAPQAGLKDWLQQALDHWPENDQ